MPRTVAIITPAFEAERWIADAARSVLAQTYLHWEHWIIADDAADYEAVLAGHGLADPRFRFVSSGAIGGGASRARNLALDRIDTDCVAILDADDRLKPQKLAEAMAALDDFAIVSTALEIMNEAGETLRFVGRGPNRALGPTTHKWVNLSMDSMLVWDRHLTDARYDPTLSNMTDLELLMQLYARAERSFHLGAPLHNYVKLTHSMSNGPGVTEKMLRSKSILLDRLAAGAYKMVDPAGPAGMARFLEISIAAEASFPAALAARAGLLFEDHLEPLLATRQA